MTDALLRLVEQGARRITVNIADLPRVEGSYLFAKRQFCRICPGEVDAVTRLCHCTCNDRDAGAYFTIITSLLASIRLNSSFEVGVGEREETLPSA